LPLFAFFYGCTYFDEELYKHLQSALVRIKLWFILPWFTCACFPDFKCFLGRFFARIGSWKRINLLQNKPFHPLFSSIFSFIFKIPPQWNSLKHHSYLIPFLLCRLCFFDSVLFDFFPKRLEIFLFSNFCSKFLSF